MWNQMANCIGRVAKELFEEFKVKRNFHKKWSAKVQEAMQKKRRCYKVLHETRNMENYEM